MSFGTRRASTLLAWLALATCTALSCTFPDFVVFPAAAGAATAGAATAAAGGMPASGSGGVGGIPQGGAGAVGGFGAVGNGGIAQGGTAAGTSPGVAGEGGDNADHVPIETGVCGERAQPQHCTNHQLDVDETDVDCGGPGCAGCAADETCKRDRDCATGACSDGKCPRPFTLTYVTDNFDAETATLRWKATLAYSGKNAVLLSDVSVRYYFSRNAVTEPILPSGSGFASATEITDITQFGVVRQLRGNGVTNDAYLEVSFGAKGSRILAQGDSIELSASAITGDGTSLFNQKTHFSFDSGTALHESKKLSIYYQGQRVWGQSPAVVDPPECFELGVNLDGSALTVGDYAWLTSPDSVLARYSNNAVSLKPATDKGREEMLRQGFFFHDQAFSYPIDNGTYAVIVYVWSADAVDGEVGTLRVQDVARDTFHATSFAGGGPWVGLGPFRVTIDNGQLKLASKGDLRVGGVELRLLDE